MSITAFPSLTESWTPDSSCLASTGFWYVVYASNVVFSNMYGMPSVTNTGQGSSPTGGCVPPSYTLSVPYLTDGGCPENYFGACSTVTSYSGRPADYIMCCPEATGWNFNCAAATDDEVAPYGCKATFASGDIITGSRTDLLAGTGQFETHTVNRDTGVNAWGIAILSTSGTSSTTTPTPSATAGSAMSTSTSSTTSSTSTPSSSPASTGLGTGASVGIGVAVGVLALALLGLLGFWLLRRRNRAKREQQPMQSQQPLSQNWAPPHGGAALAGQSYYAPSRSKTTSPDGRPEYQQQNQMYDAWSETMSRQSPPTELSGTPRVSPYEMAG